MPSATYTKTSQLDCKSKKVDNYCTLVTEKTSSRRPKPKLHRHIPNKKKPRSRLCRPRLKLIYRAKLVVRGLKTRNPKSKKRSETKTTPRIVHQLNRESTERIKSSVAPESSSTSDPMSLRPTARYQMPEHRPTVGKPGENVREELFENTGVPETSNRNIMSTHTKWSRLGDGRLSESRLSGMTPSHRQQNVTNLVKISTNGTSMYVVSKKRSVLAVLTLSRATIVLSAFLPRHVTMASRSLWLPTWRANCSATGQCPIDLQSSS